MEWSHIANAVLIAVLLICMATDIKSRLIYNKIIFPGLLLAFVFQTITGGLWGILMGIAGFGAGLAILLIPYLAGGMGAGDVKLLALVGAFKGAKFVLIASVYMAVFGAVMAIGYLLIKRGGLKQLQWTAYCMAGIRYGVMLPINMRASASAVSYPYGVAIGTGSLIVLLLDRGGVLW